MKRAMILLGVLTLIGCYSHADRQLFYEQQQAFLAAQINQAQKPLFEMKAVSGKAIENLESVVVYVPPPQYGPRDFKQFSEAHPGYEVAKQGISTAGNVIGVGLIVNGIGGMFSAMKDVAVQPKSVTNTRTSTITNINADGGSAVVAGSSRSTATVAPIAIDQTATPIILEPAGP